MRTFRLHKLVRDKLIAQQRSRGETHELRQLRGEDHAEALRQKLIEEASEIPLGAEPKIIAEELADVSQALDDLITICGISNEDVANAQAAKLAKNGGFRKGYFVETISVPDDDSWGDYYASDPERFPPVH
jgi:predicted house-cleaning noncanonical NTP pyrophosphatase (MazG superfamily)